MKLRHFSFGKYDSNNANLFGIMLLSLVEKSINPSYIDVFGGVKDLISEVPFLEFFEIDFRKISEN